MWRNPLCTTGRNVEWQYFGKRLADPQKVSLRSCQKFLLGLYPKEMSIQKSVHKFHIPIIHKTQRANHPPQKFRDIVKVLHMCSLPSKSTAIFGGISFLFIYLLSGLGSINWWINYKMLCIYTMKRYLSIKKNEITAYVTGFGGPWKHFVKWEK
jgi:hypothetical protein